MKRYGLLFFSLLLSIFTLNAQNVDGWDKMKDIYLNAIHNASDVVEENDNDFYTTRYDFQVDKWRYIVLSKEDKTVSIHPTMYWFWSNGEFWNPDTTLTGTVEIPSHVTHNDTIYTVTKISKGAFNFCVFINSLIIPETIIEIEENAFLQSFISSYTILGNNLKNVSDGAFETWIPSQIDGVTYNEYDGIIHRHCYMYSETPPEGVVFLSPDGKKRNGLLHVPVGCKEAYQQAEGWSKYGDRIVDDIDLSGVHSIKNEELKMNNEMFDLQGRRVTHPKKGEIYIQNGRKLRK